MKNLPKTRAFIWKRKALWLLDQRWLPHKTVWRKCRRWEEVAHAIYQMVVRGAPAIGCVAAHALALAAQQKKFKTPAEQKLFLGKAAEGLLQARPTAVNLRWALERMKPLWNDLTPEHLVQALEREAIAIELEDRAANQVMGRLGADLLPAGSTALTICNTGSLATAGLGTAFGVLWTAHQQGKILKVLALETRPYLQGARLTAYELQQEKIPFELITDNMAAHFMKTEKITAVFVGADRIAANGDTANKIGTYGLAVLAQYHHIPFYVVAPTSTLDPRTPDGGSIPIEERSIEEVIKIQGKMIAPKGIRARHPAFDVTPAELISAIITEKGIARPPYAASLQTQRLNQKQFFEVSA